MENDTMEEVRAAADSYLAFAGLPCSAVRSLTDLGYFDAPASKRHHLAEPGGLVRHSVNVTRWLLRMTDAGMVSWREVHSPYRIGMLHDLVKAVCYLQDPFASATEGIRYVFRQSGYVGHGTASALIAASVIGVVLSEVEVACICHHMGAWCLPERQLAELDAALDRWPAEIIATHTADMMASRVTEGVLI